MSTQLNIKEARRATAKAKLALRSLAMQWRVKRKTIAIVKKDKGRLQEFEIT